MLISIILHRLIHLLTHYLFLSTMQQLILVTGAFVASQMLFANFANAQNGSPISFNVGYDQPGMPTFPIKKSPIQIPLVYQDGNELTFATPCTGCTLQLLDTDGEVVYETTVASGTTTVVLPSSLTGTYELRLIYGDIYFYGDINL